MKSVTMVLFNRQNPLYSESPISRLVMRMMASITNGNGFPICISSVKCRRGDEYVLTNFTCVRAGQHVNLGLMQKRGHAMVIRSK